MHVDNCANHLLLAWVMRERGVVGGEFVLSDYGLYWPLHDNQLFWFANNVWHGTAVTDSEGASEGQMTLASSVPMPLWRRLSSRIRETPDTGRAELPAGGSDAIIAQSEPLGDEESGPRDVGGPRDVDFLDEFTRLSTDL